MKPTISVITPCYNSYKYMRRYFRGLETQTFKKFEIIIIDDCSTDNSYAQIREYINKSNLDIKLIRTENNNGPGEARNIGIKYAKGKWLAFCDSDDWYDERYLEIMLSTAESKKADIVMCNYRKVFDNRKSKEIDYLSNMKLFNKKEYLAQSKASLCLLLVKKRLFDNFKIPKLYNGEDMATIPILLVKAESIASTQKVLYNYYIREESTSNHPSKDIVNSLIKVFEIIEEKINEKQYYNEVEYIGVKTIIYGGTLNGFKSNMKQRDIKKMVNEFTKKYPEWQKNPYIKSLSLAKQMYIKMIGKELFFCNYIMSKIHLMYTSIL